MAVPALPAALALLADAAPTAFRPGGAVFAAAEGMNSQEDTAMTIHYVILCHARTGSNYLVNALANHPDIEAHNELFHEKTIFRANDAVNDPDEIARRDADPVTFLKAVLEKTSRPVCGFKHLLFYHEAITDYVMDNAFHLILLERENILAQYSSLQIAHQTGQWTLFPGDAPVPTQRILWDEADFEAYRRDYIQVYADLKQRAAQRTHPVLHLSYTDLFIPERIGRVFPFLGLPDKRPQDASMTRKQNTSDIALRFDQPDRVRDYMARIGRPQWEAEHIPGE